MPRCAACNGFVSHDFVRVFGNNTGTIGACLNCAPIGEYTQPEPHSTTDAPVAVHR